MCREDLVPGKCGGKTQVEEVKNVAENDVFLETRVV
jgi:hypothetical protein